jgi:hypothetical protein
MKRFLTAVGWTTLLFLGAHTAAHAQPESAAVIAKRQMSDCMSRRMAADKGLSYNEARRVCKERLQPPKDTLASINPVDTSGKAH